MASLQADLELIIDSALSSVQELGESLNNVTSEFSSTLTEAVQTALEPQVLEIDGDTTGAEESIEALDGETIEVSVDADISEADADIGSLDGETIEVTVDADISEAEADIEGLSDAVADVGVSASGSTAALDGMSGAAGIATGSLAGASGALAGFGPAGIVIAGVAGAIGTLTQSGIENNSAMATYALVVGEFGESLKRVDIGGMDMKLTDLALAFGSDESAIKEANARLFNFATMVGGVAGPAAAAYAEQVDYLAARAVALNPKLGTMADVAVQMAQKLQRGGRFAALFGLSLTGAEIAAEAAAVKLEAFGLTAEAAAVRGDDLTTMNDEQKAAIDRVRGSLTIGEKSIAGASLSMKKYGDAQDLIS